MIQSFNLVDSPWIPCIHQNGEIIEMSLRTLFIQCHKLREIVGESPLVTAALHRFLLAIAHRVHDGPTGYDQWETLWTEGQWEPTAIQNYLDTWQHRFDLFDPKQPFYQAKDNRVKFKSLNSLIHDIASGNNATLFDHHTDAEGIALEPAQAARALLATQAFGLAGLSGITEKFTNGTCAGGAIFMIQGKNLFETLMLNMIYYRQDEPLPRDIKERPAWEMDDAFADGRESPYGYLDHLTWQCRRVYLEPPEIEGDGLVHEMTIGPGLRMSPGTLDPMKHYRIDAKRGHISLRFSESRALWRDSAALFRLRNEEEDTKKYRPPLILDWLAELVSEGSLEKTEVGHLLVMGLANDQAKSEFYRSERLSLHPDYLQEKQLVDDLESILQLAEGVAKQLWGAARTLAKFIASPEHDSQTSENAREPRREDLDQIMGPWGIERAYWSRLEVPFRQTLDVLPQDRVQAAKAWKQILRRTAFDAFNTITRDLESTPRTLKAAAKGEQQLRIGLAKALKS